MEVTSVRYRSSHKQETREKILKAAGQAFRNKGFGGVGVDGLAEGARLTSGAFYVHFSSKLEAFREAVRSGLEELRAAIETFKSQRRERWLAEFASFYMNDKRACDLREGCALPALSAEVERVGGKARDLYEQKLREVHAALAAGLPGSETEQRDHAWVILALLSGGVTMARTVKDKSLSEEIANAVRNAVVR